MLVNIWPFFFHFSGDSDRDVFNEKPSREEILAATQVSRFFSFIFFFFCLVLFCFFVFFFVCFFGGAPFLFLPLASLTTVQFKLHNMGCAMRFAKS